MKQSKFLKICSQIAQRSRRSFVSASGRDSSNNGPFNASKFTTATLPNVDRQKQSADDLDDLPENCKIPLSEPLPSLPKAVYSHAPKSALFKTEITTLKNGLRVASETKFDEFCTIGVAVNAGSRFEMAYPSGVSQFLEKLAFNTTKSFQSREDTTKLIEKYGGMVDCQGTKDILIYAASCHNSGVEFMLKFIADAVFRPNFTEEEMTLAKSIVSSFIEMVNQKPEPEEILQDWIHQAAYRDNSLGLPKICPKDHVEKFRRELLYSYMKTHYTPKRMVVSGIAVQHETFANLVEKYFVDELPIWESDKTLILPNTPSADESLAQYTGGIIKVEKDLSNVSMSINPFPDLAHFVLGLESCSYKDNDFIPFCVLNSLMGGGGSFSAGGPGKGMYTRLYLNVLNRCHWMYNATSFNLAYEDTGLFYIHASASPEKLPDVVSTIVSEFIRMLGDMSDEEFERAKIQLQSMLMMNLEQRPVMFEDVARQVLSYGHRKSPLEYMDEIKRVTKKDMKRIAERLLSSKASVVGYGMLKNLPDYEKIDRAIATKDVKELQKSRSFFKLT